MTTRVVAELTHDSGNCIVEYDYNALLRIVALRCRNDSDVAAHAALIRVVDGLLYEAEFPPKQDTFIAIPTAVANRLQLVVNASGKLDGVEVQTTFPA